MSNYSIRVFALGFKKYLRLIGFGTFSIRNDKVHVTFWDCSCLSFNILLGFFVFYLSLEHGLQRLEDYSLLLALGVLITMMCGSAVTILSMVLVCYHREVVWELITSLDIAIEKFKKIQVFPDFKRYVMIFVFFAVLSVILISIGLIIMGLLEHSVFKPGAFLTYGYLSTSLAASLGWSSMFHLSIYLRLYLINKTIR